MLRSLLFTSLLGLGFCAAAASPLAGTWRIDTARSTELSPWRSYDLKLEVNGDEVVIHRRLAWGRRVYEDVTPVNVAADLNEVPADFWPDNRHLGAYMGGDRIKRIRAEWHDDRRLLRLSTDLTLETQQGERAINTLSDYKVSANGSRLTLVELRSTRNRPVIYVFTRIEN
jgi:hypothetical protein